MNIVYIGHSGFLAELEKTVILFDYVQGELPEIAKEKKWYVFASHRHSDHFSPKVFCLAEKYQNVSFIFSRDIWRSQVPENLQEQVVQIKPGKRWEDGQIQVETLKSTDEGVAFLVRAEGKVLYHAGDLNDWQWEGESKEWNRKMKENYRKFCEPLRGMKIDAAFVPLDPRQGKDYALGMDYFLCLADAEAVYPMHCWEDYSIIDRWFAEHPDHPYQKAVRRITKKGEVFSEK